MKSLFKSAIAVFVAALLFTWFFCMHSSSISFWIMFPIFLLLTVLLTHLRRVVSHIFPRKKNGRLASVCSAYHRIGSIVEASVSDRAFFLCLWLLLSLCYLPAYLALFPGTFGYDGPVQVAQYFGDNALTSHHPLLHTFLLGIFFSLGQTLFHSYSAGFAVYTALQGFIVTGSMAYSMALCRKKRVPLAVIALGFLWTAFNPLFQLLTFASTKDILFGAFLLCFAATLWDVPQNGAPSAGYCCRLALFGSLTCLFRNQGIYILAIVILFALLTRLPRKICLSLVIALAASQLLTTACSAAWDIPKGDKREMLPVPIQQLAYVGSLYLNGGQVSMTPEQYAAVSELILPEGILSFTSESADPAKFYFQTDLLLENPGKYLRLYLELGVQNPGEYLHAWRNLIYPYWFEGANIGFTFCYTFPEYNHWEVSRNSLFPLYYDHLVRKALKMSADANFGNLSEKLLWRPEICLWLLAGLLGCSIAGNRRLLLGILPFLLYFLTMILGPVALLRYIYPLMIATPLLLGAATLQITDRLSLSGDLFPYSPVRLPKKTK